MVIQRDTEQIVGFAVPSSAGTNKGLAFGSYSSGQIRVPAQTANGLTTLTWYSGDTIGGPWYPVQDGAGNAVTSSIGSGNSCLIPVLCFGCKFLLPTGDQTSVINLDLIA